jgi:hypothetical protein
VDASRNEVRVLSHPQGQGAEIAGLNRAPFLDELFRAQVPACKVTIDELIEEVDRVVEANRQRKIDAIVCRSWLTRVAMPVLLDRIWK